MRQNPDNKSFSSEKFKKWAYGVFATAVLFFLSCGSPSGGQENKTQVPPPVANPKPLIDYSLTPQAVRTGEPVVAETPVPVMHPEPPVIATPPRR